MKKNSDFLQGLNMDFIQSDLFNLGHDLRCIPEEINLFDPIQTEFFKAAQALRFTPQEIKVLDSDQWYRPLKLAQLRKKIGYQYRIIKCEFVMEDIYPHCIIFRITVVNPSRKIYTFKWIE